MKIIEKIEIKHFRSFIGTPRKYEFVIEDVSDLNIFSGANDSGKSNILRALNLFFNKEISTGQEFEFSRDFFIGKKDAPFRVVEISISFNLSEDKQRDKFLPERFKISRYYDRNGFRNSVYSFKLKEHEKEIRVDDRSEKNDHVAEIFTPRGATKEEKQSAKKREWNYRVKFAGFLNKSISFEYVPAIRDRKFFSHLFGRVIASVKHKEEQKILLLNTELTKIKEWEDTVKNKSEKRDFIAKLKNASWRSKRTAEIGIELKRESNLALAIQKLEIEINKYSNSLISSIGFLESEFRVGKDLQDFFEGFDIGTGEGKEISLSLRGDGVQAKYVPKILNFLSTLRTDKKYSIWAIEEPENSAEYKNQQELAHELKNSFSSTKQVFITTHSEEFLQLYDGLEVPAEAKKANLYHVKKLNSQDYGQYSKIYKLNPSSSQFLDSTNDIFRDLGQSYLRALHSKELIGIEERFLKEKEDQAREIEYYKDLLIQASKPLLFVEDKYDQIYKTAWLILNNYKPTEKDFEDLFDKHCPFLICKSEGASCLSGFLRTKNIDVWRNKKIVGLFDFDEEGLRQFKLLSNESYWKSELKGTKKTGYLKKRNSHDAFYGMLIPVPPSLENLADLSYPSFVEIENLLPETFLISNNFASSLITTGNTSYLKVDSSKKNILWKKLFTLRKTEFQNFKPLFETVNKAFDI